MYIREATPDDNKELQELQAKCPQGKTLIVSTVNTPDFFARVKAYESYMITPIAFKEPSHLTPLLRYLNNEAVSSGINKNRAR